jgi:hypothetical protein
MKIGLISIALLPLLLPGCSRHRDQRTAQANREPTHVASLPPAGVRPESLTKVAPQTLDRSRPSPFSDRPELELQQPALSQSARIAPAPSAVAPPSRAKIATKPEEKRKTLKPFNPKVADPSRDRVALLPVPPRFRQSARIPCRTRSLATRPVVSEGRLLNRLDPPACSACWARFPDSDGFTRIPTAPMDMWHLDPLARSAWCCLRRLGPC